MHLHCRYAERESCGQYTRDTLTRIGIMSGQLGTRIVEMLGGGHKRSSATKEAAQATQVAEFVGLYKDDELIRTVPGRKLNMQPKFEFQTEIKKLRSIHGSGDTIIGGC